MNHAQRRDRLRVRLAEAGLDALLVSHLVNVRYLSGFTGTAGQLLVTAEADTLVTDGRYAEQAAEQAPDVALVVTRTDDWLADALTGVGRLGLESHTTSWDRARRLDELADAEVVAAPHHVETLRQTKDDDELDSLRRACAVTAAAFEAACGWLTPGLTEAQVGRRLVDELTSRGAAGPAFDPIVASGPNGARPHHRGGERPLARGDLVTMDFGGLVDGYHADMTRTVALAEPDPGLRDVYELVRAAQEAGVAAVAAGASAGDIDAACRQPIAEAGHGEHFVHGTGHGVGLEIHEDPILRAGADDRLALGMAVTVEPGVYLPGTGGVRIEDVVAVTSEGHEILTAAPRDLLIL